MKPMRNRREPPYPAFKTLALVRDVPADVHGSLGRVTRRRFDNQLTRAFQQSFGAEQGLRVVVRLATLEMLRSGASLDEITHELSDVVAQHPANAPRTMPGDARVAGLTGMIVRWSRSAASTSDGV